MYVIPFPSYLVWLTALVGEPHYMLVPRELSMINVRVRTASRLRIREETQGGGSGAQ
jgi:hypothetical protein